VLQLHPNLFSTEDCVYLASIAEQAGFARAGGLIHAQSALVRDEPLATWIWNKIGPLAPTNSIGIGKRIRFYQYSVGDEFEWHIDPSIDKSHTTVVICLIAPLLGGETEFDNGTLISYQAGDVLMFPHQMLHRGRPVIQGTKLILRADII
jgi:hypothetical protein